MEHKSPAYVAVLAVIAGSILVVGSLMKPEKPAEKDAVLLPEVGPVRLPRITQRGSLEQMAEFFADLGSTVGRHLVRVDSLESSGLVWDAEGRIVTANRPGPLSGRTVAHTFRPVPTELTVSFRPPHLPVAVFRADPAARLPFPLRVPARTLDPGEWAVAVWRSEEEQITHVPGFFLGFRTRVCAEAEIDQAVLSFPVSEEMSGGGLFDLDGRLVAVIAECDGRFVAIAQESVEKLFMQAGTLEGQLLGRYGLRVAPLSEVEQRYFEVSEGIVINEVWDGYLGARTGLEPGDLIVSMDGAAVRGVEDVRKLVLPVAREFHELAVRRGQRTRKVSLPARSSSEVTLDADHSGALLAAPQGFPIGTVIKGSPAAQAGIQPGDRLLRVDQTQIRTDAQARQALANGSGRPRYLVLSRGARRWGALLQ